mgnify:CR=1 FL=1
MFVKQLTADCIDYFARMTVTVMVTVCFLAFFWNADLHRKSNFLEYIVFTVSLLSMLSVSYWLSVILSVCTSAPFIDRLSLFNNTILNSMSISMHNKKADDILIQSALVLRERSLVQFDVTRQYIKVDKTSWS